MARMNVYLPDELDATVRAKLPDLNVSALLQRGLQAALECRHARMVCAECAMPVDQRQAIDDALCAFFIDLHWRLVELVDRGGTAEGAGRIAHDIATRHRLSCAPNFAAPRPSRAARRSSRVVELPDKQTRKQTA